MSYCPRTTIRSLALVFLLFATVASGQTMVADPPVRPLIELLFSNDLQNTGTLNAQARAVTFVSGKGPGFGPGIRGVGLDLTATSRAGGTATTPAGGAVRIDGDGIANLRQMTLVLWFKPVADNTVARLLYYAPSWDLFVTHATIGFKTRHAKKDLAHVTPRDARVASPLRWHFLAVTVDDVHGRIQCFHGTRTAAPSLVCTWRNVPKLDRGPASLTIGNLGAIRPFKGYIDSVRIYDAILSRDELRTLYRIDNSSSRDLFGQAAVMPRRDAVFAHADVCLSSRSIHPNSIATLKDFQANRLVWCYSTKASFIDQCKNAGADTYQAAINSLPGHDNHEAQCLDLDGKPVVAPWMVAFNREKPVYWGCNNRPRFLETSVQRVRQALDNGADWIQFDDWAMIVSAHSWGGACFCDDCMTAFRQYLKQRLDSNQQSQLGIHDLQTFDYRRYLANHDHVRTAAAYKKKWRALQLTPLFEDFQRRSVRRFFATLRQQINTIAGHKVPMSINATFLHPDQRSNFLVDQVDFLQGETWHFDLAELAMASRTAEGLGKWQVFVPKPRSVKEARKAIAATYAMGQLMLIPWDMYMGSDAQGIKPRYYGTAADYADLFHFVRVQRALLDGFRNVPTTGVIVNLDHLDTVRTRSLVTRLLDAQVPFTFLPVGHAYYECHLAPDRLEHFELLIVVGDQDVMPAEDRTLIHQAAVDVIVMPDNKVSSDLLRDVSPIQSECLKGIYVLPRINPDAAKKTLVCHVLNRVDMGSVEQLQSVPFMLKRSAFLGSKLIEATWQAPGQSPRSIRFQLLPAGARIVVPQVAEWGIVALQFDNR